MTLLVGIRCTDGVVVAADSAVTFGPSVNLHTISDAVCKITIIKERLIVAGTGQVGLGQRFHYVLDDLWTKGELKGGAPVPMSSKMASRAIAQFQETGASKGAYGALVAFPASNKAELCEFATADLQPELKTAQMWYSSMGSGQLLADPYLRLMRHIFWHNGPPNLQAGKFAAMWVMRHAIEAAPGGIAEPIDMAVLEPAKGGHVARMLDQDELKEHIEAVKSATEHFREFEQKLLGSVTTATPSLPKLTP